MNVTTVKKAGKVYAMLPMEEFQRIAEGAEDAADIEAFDRALARGEEAFPITLFDAIDDGANPIRVFREYRDMKQFEFAEAIGMSKSYVNEIENNKKEGSIKILKKIAIVLNVSLDLLV